MVHARASATYSSAKFIGSRETADMKIGAGLIRTAGVLLTPPEDMTDPTVIGETVLTLLSTIRPWQFRSQ